jgi:hypothetical protein
MLDGAVAVIVNAAVLPFASPAAIAEENVPVQVTNPEEFEHESPVIPFVADADP